MKAWLHIESRMVLASLLLGLVWTTATRTAIIQVPAAQSTIQAAVTTAKSNDTIQIASGASPRTSPNCDSF